jgi:hypothetical protein
MLQMVQSKCQEMAGHVSFMYNAIHQIRWTGYRAMYCIARSLSRQVTVSGGGRRGGAGRVVQVYYRTAALPKLRGISVSIFLAYVVRRNVSICRK